MRWGLAKFIWVVKRGGCAWLAGGMVWFVAGTGLQAQTDSPLAIRVESDEVVVPVVVLDRTHREMTPTALEELDEEISDLGAGDFHVFEDDVEQPVERVSRELPRIQDVQDNLAHHIEASFTPRGIWTSPDLGWPSGGAGTSVSPLSTYMVSYRPRTAANGSCHRIKVRVRRHHATVYARDEYCGTQHPLSDPLGGTQLARQMQEYADSQESGAFPVYVQAGWFTANQVASRVDVVVEYASSAITRRWKRVNLYATVAVMGVVRDKNEKLVARFSDMSSTAPWNFYRGPLPPDRSFLKSWELAGIPSRYETQMQLAPGDYELSAVVTDGEKFGKARIPIRVEGETQHALSYVFLCKRFHPTLVGAEAAARAPQYVAMTSRGLEFTPAGDTRFSREQRLFAYFEIYEGLVNASRNFRIRIADGGSGEVKLDTGPRMVEAGLGRRRGIPIAAEMAIDTLSAGTYVMEVEVTDARGVVVGRRTKEFAVE
jgi:hypothetical protein